MFPSGDFPQMRMEKSIFLTHSYLSEGFWMRIPRHLILLFVLRNGHLRDFQMSCTATELEKQMRQLVMIT